MGRVFSICFIDVGQGDAALVECDGHYMLIDGGDKAAGKKVYDVLEKQGIQHLDILSVSHLHEDHIGGLIEALKYVSSIKQTISNAANDNTETFREFEHQLYIDESEITVPANGDSYKLGSATVEVIDVCANENNDSLVLLITYGDTRFLFTGDIERNGQLRVAEALHENEENKFNGQSLIKMPHHGAYNDNNDLPETALYRLFREYDPSYFIISVGENNQYGHPHQDTLKLIEEKVDTDGEDWVSHVYRTDENGDILVKSDGKKIYFETFK